mmetsp:Transcript_42806/g.99945  ORF Transcript_42806/g.99945 Transcript_42806/m.99945 type:complete len:220 (+) Transcript_42806:585-1244(+)
MAILLLPRAPCSGLVSRGARTTGALRGIASFPHDGKLLSWAWRSRWAALGRVHQTDRYRSCQLSFLALASGFPWGLGCLARSWATRPSHLAGFVVALPLIGGSVVTVALARPRFVARAVLRILHNVKIKLYWLAIAIAIAAHRADGSERTCPRPVGLESGDAADRSVRPHMSHPLGRMAVRVRNFTPDTPERAARGGPLEPSLSCWVAPTVANLLQALF